MKVVLLTLHCIKNYGSVLQTVASQHLLSDFFDEVETYNYIRPMSENNRLTDSWTVNDSGIKKMLKKAIYFPMAHRFVKVFDSFLKNNVHLTDKEYHSLDDFERYPVAADAYCVGSDQVWNSDWNNGYQGAFFLDFLKNKEYCFSLSSSIGKEKWDLWERDMTKEGLKKFSHLSVREASAKRLIEELGFEGVEHLLDPTLLVERDFWTRYTGTRKVKGDYVLVYQLNSNREFDDYAKKFARKKGMKLVRIGLRYKSFARGGNVFFIPKVEEFLSFIKYASYIITDSFHGTVFSIIFNKKFAVVYPDRFSTRLENILCWGELESHQIKDFYNLSIPDQLISYQKINAKLDLERRKAEKYLKLVCDDIKR